MENKTFKYWIAWNINKTQEHPTWKAKQYWNTLKTKHIGLHKQYRNTLHGKQNI